MANREFVMLKIGLLIGLIIICPIFVLPIIGFAYSDDTTHRAITNEATKVFNHYYSDRQLSTDDRESIIKGSKEEDTPPRWLNHFYDPVYQQGFRGLLSSKNWAQNTTAQSMLLNKSPLAEYFSSPADYSWDRAIYDYVYGDRGRGLEALGHVLHLIQDTTVPDHTRDDAHPIWSTYEHYAKQFDISNTILADNLLAQNQKPIIFSNLDSYFDYLATFSNNNFFSDDTIFSNDYYNPKNTQIVSQRLSDGSMHLFGNNNLGVRLLEIERFVNLKTNKIEETYLLNDIDDIIPSNYWQNLSSKAVLASAGVIKLFFDEVEKEKQTKRLFEKNKSFVQKFLNNLNNGLGQLLASVNLVGGQTAPGKDNLSNGLGSFIDEINQLAEEKNEEIKTPTKLSPDEIKKELERIKQEIASLLQSPEAARLLVSSTTENILPLKNLVSSGGGGQIVSEIIDSASSTDYLVIDAPTILTPDDFSEIFSTTTITFLGTTTSGNIVFNDFNTEFATSSDDGLWTITLIDLPQGTNTINFFARNPDGNVSLPAEVSFQIDSLPLIINLVINNCQQSLSPDFCLLKPTSTLNFVWLPTKAGDYHYNLLKAEKDPWSDWLTPEIVASSLLETEITLDPSLEPNDLLREFKWQIVAYQASSSEIVATSSEIITTFHPRPMVINEISWAGTTASDRDEWLELKNYLTDYSFDLANYYLTDTDQNWRINLSGQINADGYYLIERGSDEVVSNRQAKLIDNFGLDPSSKIFNQDSFGLKLWHSTEGRAELIDETPTWSRSGSASSTLERTFDFKSSTDLSAWEDNFGCEENDGPCALDRNATTTFGTPGVINFASIPRLW